MENKTKHTFEYKVYNCSIDDFDPNWEFEMSIDGEETLCIYDDGECFFFSLEIGLRHISKIASMFGETVTGIVHDYQGVRKSEGVKRMAKLNAKYGSSIVWDSEDDDDEEEEEIEE